MNLTTFLIQYFRSIKLYVIKKIILIGEQN